MNNNYNHIVTRPMNVCRQSLLQVRIAKRMKFVLGTDIIVANCFGHLPPATRNNITAQSASIVKKKSHIEDLFKEFY